MGDQAAGSAYPSPGGEGTRSADQLVDVARIAEAVRDVVQARATMISRVVDDDWLEVVVVAGAPSRDDLVGHRWERAAFEALLQEAEQRGRLHLTTRRSVSYVEVPEDGWDLPGLLGLLLAPLRNAQGDLVGVLTTEGPVDTVDPAPGVCDRIELYVDQARLAVEALRDQQVVDELRELDQYRRDLVASITHDLKTPLTAIALNTELLESDQGLEQPGHPVAAIRRSADRLSSLVDDLLALSRTEAGGLAGRTEVGDVSEIVRQACRHAEGEAQLRAVTFSVDMPEQLSAKVDVDALVRVYTNVVSNAVKFSLPDGQVRLTLRRDGDDVVLTCSDDGIGISPEDQAAVFEMFRRSDDPLARVVPGTGMGLAISQRIVTRLGGRIGLESTPGEGSTFTVRIPG